MIIHQIIDQKKIDSFQLKCLIFDRNTLYSCLQSLVCISPQTLVDYV